MSFAESCFFNPRALYSWIANKPLNLRDPKTRFLIRSQESPFKPTSLAYICINTLLRANIALALKVKPPFLPDSLYPLYVFYLLPFLSNVLKIDQETLASEAGIPKKLLEYLQTSIYDSEIDSRVHDPQGKRSKPKSQFNPPSLRYLSLKPAAHELLLLTMSEYSYVYLPAAKPLRRLYIFSLLQKLSPYLLRFNNIVDSDLYSGIIELSDDSFPDYRYIVKSLKDVVKKDSLFGLCTMKVLQQFRDGLISIDCKSFTNEVASILIYMDAVQDELDCHTTRIRRCCLF